MALLPVGPCVLDFQLPTPPISDSAAQAFRLLHDPHKCTEHSSARLGPSPFSLDDPTHRGRQQQVLCAHVGEHVELFMLSGTILSARIIGTVDILDHGHDPASCAFGAPDLSGAARQKFWLSVCVRSVLLCTICLSESPSYGTTSIEPTTSPTTVEANLRCSSWALLSADNTSFRDAQRLQGAQVICHDQAGSGRVLSEAPRQWQQAPGLPFRDIG